MILRVYFCKCQWQIQKAQQREKQMKKKLKEALHEVLSIHTF